MFTQCQHCLTMFRITLEQLSAADGKVRCCRCNNIFNARLHLIESPVSFINDSTMLENLSLTDTGMSAISQPGPSDADPDGESTIKPKAGLTSDSEIERSLDALADEHLPTEPLAEESILELEEHNSELDSQNQYLLERDDGLETEPEYFAAGTESQMSELLDQDSASLLLGEIDNSDHLADVISFQNQEKNSQVETAPEDESSTIEDSSAPREAATSEAEPIIPDDSHDAIDESTPSEEEAEQEPTSGFIPQRQDTSTDDEATLSSGDSIAQESRFTFEEEYEKPQSSRFSRYWTAGAFVLLLTLCGQTAWYLRDSLITHDAGRQILEGICTLTGCSLPVRRDTEQIIISNRTLTVHPDFEEILSLKLEMVNTAAFQQPFPKLQLTLYNDMGAIIARRTFQPHEYNADQYGPDQMMPRLKAVQIALELQDPGNQVTGFKFDFL